MPDDPSLIFSKNWEILWFFLAFLVLSKFRWIFEYKWPKFQEFYFYRFKLVRIEFLKHKKQVGNQFHDCRRLLYVLRDPTFFHVGSFRRAFVLNDGLSLHNSIVLGFRVGNFHHIKWLEKCQELLKFFPITKNLFFHHFHFHKWRNWGIFLIFLSKLNKSSGWFWQNLHYF